MESWSLLEASIYLVFFRGTQCAASLTEANLTF